jgi:choline dehydrogenase
MLQFYHRTMNFTPPNSLDRGANATPMYNPNNTVTGGGLAVTYLNYAQPWATWLARGIEAIGIQRVDSFINGNLFGQAFNMDTINQTDGFRSSSQAAYLRPVLSRPNLAVFDLIMAERVIFNHQKEATGVLIAKDCILTANKEVILSAGLFKSPQMLMVSGVGPAALLKSLNIPVVADRPGVGQNMKDHLATFVTYQVNLLTGSELDVNASYLEDSINKFNFNATGPLASPGGDSFAMEVIPEDLRGNWSAETNESLAQLPPDWPHIGYAAFPSIGRGTPSIPIDATGNYASSLAIMIAPQSTGNVSISSANITDPPIINPMYFTNPADLDILVAAIKRLRQAFKSSALAPILIGPEVLPGEDVQTDEEIETYLRKTSYSMAHGFSTNRWARRTIPWPSSILMAGYMVSKIVSPCLRRILFTP